MKIAETPAYPLEWPSGWGRTSPDKRVSDNLFKQGNGYAPAAEPGGVPSYVGRRKLTLATARDKLIAELGRINARNCVISSNVRLRLDGLPYSNQAEPDDPGAAVYFMLKGRPLVMASDRYYTVAGNLRSIGLAVEAMRQLERHGGGTMMERAFSGFVAIAPPVGNAPGRKSFRIRPNGRPIAKSSMSTSADSLARAIRTPAARIRLWPSSMSPTNKRSRRSDNDHRGE